jgi:chromosome partitioning protein
MSEVIVINNNKGGVGKTTLATNLAGVLALEGKKVLIIDADNQSNVSLSFGINPDNLQYSLYDVLVDKLPVEYAIKNVYKHIDIIPSNTDLIGFDFKVINNKEFPQPFSIMKTILEPVKENYDYVLIDTPPSLSLIVGNTFHFADSVLIPFTPESYSMRSLIKVLETINDFKEVHNPSLKLLGVLPTMIVTRTSLHSQILQETRRFCLENDINIFETVIPKSIRFASTIAYENLPATLSKKGKEAGEVYFELWKEIKEYA